MNLHREQWTQGLVMKRFEDHQTSNEKTVEVGALMLAVSLPPLFDACLLSSCVIVFLVRFSCSFLLACFVSFCVSFFLLYRGLPLCSTILFWANTEVVVGGWVLRFLIGRWGLGVAHRREGFFLVGAKTLLLSW